LSCSHAIGVNAPFGAQRRGEYPGLGRHGRSRSAWGRGRRLASPSDASSKTSSRNCGSRASTPERRSNHVFRDHRSYSMTEVLSGKSKFSVVRNTTTNMVRHHRVPHADRLAMFPRCTAPPTDLRSSARSHAPLGGGTRFAFAQSGQDGPTTQVRVGTINPPAGDTPTAATLLASPELAPSARTPSSILAPTRPELNEGLLRARPRTASRKKSRTPGCTSLAVNCAIPRGARSSITYSASDTDRTLPR